MHNTPHSQKTKDLISVLKTGVPAIWNRRASKIHNGVTLWICGRCKEFFPREGFYRNKRTLLGLTSHCRSCHCAITISSRDKGKTCDLNREYMRRARVKSPETFRERERAHSKVRKKDPIKVLARRMLNAAVKKQIVRKPLVCAECGQSKELTGHHHDYSKPLDVRWLCYECHGLEHRSLVP